MVRNGDITYGGRVMINPSGGLISKGHTLGATGLAQCCELTWQLRGWAKKSHLVKGIDAALQHNLGLGGAVVVTVYKRADGRKNTDTSPRDAEIAQSSGLGYNPAVECRTVSLEDANKVQSTTMRSQYALGDLAAKPEARL